VSLGAQFRDPFIRFGITKNPFATINDQPFPLPRYFGIGHLSVLASGVQIMLWVAAVALGSSPAAQDEEVEVAGCEWLMPEHDFC